MQQLLALNEGGLIKIGETPSLANHGIDFSFQFGELRLKEFVVRGLTTCRHRLLAVQQHVGTQQRVADLLEDEGIEFVGADIAPRATTMLAAGPERVMVATVVVAVERAIAPAHLVARHAHLTVTALDQPAQQPVSGFGAPGIPLRVVATDTLRRLEQFIVQDRRDRDGNPLISRAPHLTRFPRQSPVRHSLGSIGVDTADVGLVAQDARDRRYAPHRLPTG